MGAGNRLLVVAKDDKMISRAFGQLKQLGYTIEVKSRLAEAVYIASRNDADVILVGSGFKRKDVLAVFSSFTNDMKIPCFVFAETPSTSVINSMLSMRIPNVLVPPISPRGLHERISQLRAALSTGIYTPSENTAPAAPEMEEVKQTIVNGVGSLLGQVQKLVEKAPKNAGRLRRVLVAHLRWNQYPLYVLIGIDGLKGDSHTIDVVGATLTKLLKDAGRSGLEPEELWDTELDFDHFTRWAINSTEVLGADLPGGGKLTVALVDAATLPEIVKHPKAEYLEVKLGKWLMPNTEMPADMYLHLPANNRFVLYLKRRSRVSDDVISRVLRLETPSLFIPPVHRGPFIGYCLRTTAAQNESAKVAVGADEDDEE